MWKFGSRAIGAFGLVISSVVVLQLIIVVHSKKIPFGNAGVELGDYRLRNGEPFVSLFEHENFRGKIYRQRVERDCTNIPQQYDNWASSIILHDRCVTICEQFNCQGACKNLYPNLKGVKRLTDLQLNDKATSLKFCYQYG